MSKIAKPIAIQSPNYRRRISTIYALVAFVFFVGGAVAFAFDSVTLPGRSGAAHFDGAAAHAMGMFCFFVTAYWASKIVLEHHGRHPISLIPYIIAAIVSVALLAYKYG